VVAERSKYLERTAVVIGFQEPVPEFWGDHFEKRGLF
jgi:hypothetical protein